MTGWSQKLCAASSCPSWDWPQDKWRLSESLRFGYRLCNPNYRDLQLPPSSKCWWSLSDSCGHRSCKLHRDGHISRPSKLQKPPASYQIAPDTSIIWLRWWSSSVTCSPNTEFAYSSNSNELQVSTQATVAPVADPVFITVRVDFDQLAYKPDERWCWFLRWSKLRAFRSMCELRESYAWSNNNVVWIHSPHVILIRNSLHKHSTCVRADKVEKIQSKSDLHKIL